MRPTDWVVLVATLLIIVAYGVWKGRRQRLLASYLLADRKLRFPTIALSIMATLASAITFLSTPGQAYVDGMRFVQLPRPAGGDGDSLDHSGSDFSPVESLTAYEYLKTRFGVGTRTLTVILFLIQRGFPMASRVVGVGRHWRSSDCCPQKAVEDSRARLSPID